MANYTFLNITVFGSQENLNMFDLFPPKFKGPNMEISTNGKSIQSLSLKSPTRFYTGSLVKCKIFHY